MIEDYGLCIAQLWEWADVRNDMKAGPEKGYDNRRPLMHNRNDRALTFCQGNIKNIAEAVDLLSANR